MVSGSVTLEASIIHDPRRSANLPGLAAAIAAGGLTPHVCTDGAGTGGPLESFRCAAADAAPGTTHLLLLEDDAEPCPGFVAAARRAAAARPFDALYLSATRAQAGDAMDRAARRGLSWAAVTDRIVGTVAVVLPLGLARRCFFWLLTGGEDLCAAWHPDTPGAFDCRLYEYLVTVCGVAPLVSVWSLAGHGSPMPEESLVRPGERRPPRFAYRPVRGVLGEDGYDTPPPDPSMLDFCAAPETRFNIGETRGR